LAWTVQRSKPMKGKGGEELLVGEGRNDREIDKGGGGGGNY